LLRSRHHEYSHAVIPQRPFHAQNMASSKVLDRLTHHLSLERTRDVRTVKPITKSNPAASAHLGELSAPPSLQINQRKLREFLSPNAFNVYATWNLAITSLNPAASFARADSVTPSGPTKKTRSCASFCHSTPSTDMQHETSRWQAPCQRRSSSSSADDRLC